MIQTHYNDRKGPLYDQLAAPLIFEEDRPMGQICAAMDQSPMRLMCEGAIPPCETPRGGGAKTQEKCVSMGAEIGICIEINQWVYWTTYPGKYPPRRLGQT